MINKKLEIITDFTVKSIDEDTEDIIISGYANTTDKDRANDVILESAWTQGGMDNYENNPILLAYHDHTRPVGKMTDYSVNKKGLHITGKITKAAGDVYDLVKEGILQAFSVGFRVKDAEYDTDTDIFVIKDAELHEISIVAVGMNQNSLFSVKKSFENEKEYNEFKDSFNNVEDTSTHIEVEDASSTKKEAHMPIEKKDGVIELTPEQLKSQLDDAIAKAFADAKAKADADEAARVIAVEAGKTGAESLIADVKKQFEDERVAMEKALEGFQTELKEKSAEIEAMTKSKMSFEESSDRGKLTDAEIDTAYLVAKIVNKKVDETEYFAGLKQKLGDHLDNANYEMIYSTRMFDAIQDKLVIEPMFNANKIAMTSRSMTFPFNPQAGYASWVADSDYKSLINPATEVTQADGTYTDYNSSTAVPRNHQITTISLTAEKLASKEAIGYEEEEDSIIPILPIVREAIAKRMARSTDTELLRGNVGVATVTDIGPSLINGVATLGSDDGAVFVQGGTFATTNPITVADLQSTRRLMGSYGLNPNDVTYVVCESAYWDLLEDPDFRTMELVGANATILRGQVGAVNGSPVVVSDSFAAPAIDGYAAIALNTSNYLFGQLRGLNTERDKDILNQKNWIVTTRRFAFNEIASGTAILNSCAVLQYPNA